MKTTQIVETVTARDMASLRRRRDAVADADLVELRLDGVRDLEVAGALRDRTRPCVVTCRPAWEGGLFDGSEEVRRRILNEAVALGAEFVDIERRAEWRPDRQGAATRLVLSDHEFAEVPSDLAARVLAMRREQPDVVKVSAMARSASDCLTLRDACRGDGLTVVIAMGDFGRVTRVLPARFGSCWTYGGTAAPGQCTAGMLARQFRVRQTGAGTGVYAVTGRPLGHSASPAMHNASFQAMGLDAVYVPLEATGIGDAQAVADAIGVAGMSVTAPFKRGWSATLDDDASRELGAVNTLKREPAGWLGRNVDGEGFLDPLDTRDVRLRGARAVILGAGGAARSVGRALQRRGSVVHLSARRSDEAERVARKIGAAVASWPPAGHWDLVVNATPAGTWPRVEESPLPDWPFTAALAYDLVYNPAETEWLRRARAAGADVIGGLEMLVGQAVRQQMWWTGRSPSRAVMTEAARTWIAASAGRVSDETDNV